MHIKKKTILLLSIIGIAIAAISFFVIIPSARNIKKISLQISSLKIEAEKNYDDRISMRAAISKIKTIKRESEKFMNIYVKENDELVLITDIEKIAEKNNLKQEINLAEKLETDKGNKMGIQITLHGAYIDVIKYLYELRRLPYYINIYSLNINKSAKKDSNQNNTEKVSANLAGDFYFMPEE